MLLLRWWWRCWWWWRSSTARQKGVKRGAVQQQQQCSAHSYISSEIARPLAILRYYAHGFLLASRASEARPSWNMGLDARTESSYTYTRVCVCICIYAGTARYTFICARLSGSRPLIELPSRSRAICASFHERNCTRRRRRRVCTRDYKYTQGGGVGRGG